MINIYILICLSLISTVSLEAENHRKPKGTNFGWGVSRAIIVVSSNKFCAMQSCSVCWMALNKCLKLTECNYIFMLLSICWTVTSHVLCPRLLDVLDVLFQNAQTMYSRFIQNAYTTSPLCLCTALALIEASLCRAAFFWPSQELSKICIFSDVGLEGSCGMPSSMSNITMQDNLKIASAFWTSYKLNEDKTGVSSSITCFFQIL